MFHRIGEVALGNHTRGAGALDCLDHRVDFLQSHIDGRQISCSKRTAAQYMHKCELCSRASFYGAGHLIAGITAVQLRAIEDCGSV